MQELDGLALGILVVPVIWISEVHKVILVVRVRLFFRILYVQ